MFVKLLKKSQAKGTRTFASATHILNPGKPRDKCVTICPGEGIGEQLIESVLEIFSYMRVPIRHKVVEYSSLKKNSENLDLKQNNCLLLGPVSHKSNEERSEGVCSSQILNELGVFASILNLVSISGAQQSSDDVNLLLIQQNNPKFQVNMEKTTERNEFDSCITHECDLNRFARYVFANAVMERRSKITFMHQNTNEESDRCLTKFMRKFANENSNIMYDEIHSGLGSSKIVANPELFDVIVTSNNNDDTISTSVMNLVGGEGLVPTVHIGDKFTIFQQGGNYPQYEKVDMKSANPTGILLSASMMLRQTNLPIFADLLEESVYKTYLNSEVRTPDIGGNYSTKEFSKKVMENIFRQTSVHNIIPKTKSSFEM